MIIQELITIGKMAYKEWGEKKLFKSIKLGSGSSRSIASMANDSTYYFPVVASEFMSADEVAMVTRALERNYAIFTRTAFSLIPAITVQNFNDSTVRDYLSKFHSNIGNKPSFALDIKLESTGFNERTLNEDSFEFDLSKGRTGPSMMTSSKVDSFGQTNTFKQVFKTNDTEKTTGFKDSVRLISDSDWKKANDMVPTSMTVPVKFVDNAGNYNIVEIMVNVKANMHRASSSELVRDISNTVVAKKGFLSFVKWFSGEEKSTADFLFGVSQMKQDILNKKANMWIEAFKRRKRLAELAWGTLENNFKPIATICLTMNEVNTLKNRFNFDVFKEASKLMKQYYLLGFVIVDQVNEIVHTQFDGQPGFQEYPYKTLERESANQDRVLKDMVKAMGAIR